MSLNLPPRFLALALSYAGAIAFVALAALAAHLLEPALPAPDIALLFVPAVLAAAIWLGAGPAIAAAIVATLTINFLFVAPRYTFDVARPQDVSALIVFLVTAVLTSALAARARNRAIEATRRAEEAEALQTFAHDLSDAGDIAAIAAAASRAVKRLFNRRASLSPATDAPEAARWAMSTKLRYDSNNLGPGEDSWTYWPIKTGAQTQWALGVEGNSDVALDRIAEQIAAHTGVALERLHQAELAATARLDAESERLKSTLLAGVSHDLRTPLTTIVFTLESLRRFAKEHSAEAHDDLLALAEMEARRLSRLVETLLTASRIEDGAIPVKLETIAPSGVIEAGVHSAGIGKTLRFDADAIAHLPLIRADRALAERVLATVFENAARYTAGGITLAARSEDGVLQITIEDEGPGLGADPERLFQKFVRGVESDGRAPGLGLGLAIARAYMLAQRGSISAENHDPHGARFTLTFPLAAEAAHAR